MSIVYHVWVLIDSLKGSSGLKELNKQLFLQRRRNND